MSVGRHSALFRIDQPSDGTYLIVEVIERCIEPTVTNTQFKNSSRKPIGTVANIPIEAVARSMGLFKELEKLKTLDRKVR